MTTPEREYATELREEITELSSQWGAIKYEELKTKDEFYRMLMEPAKYPEPARRAKQLELYEKGEDADRLLGIIRSKETQLYTLNVIIRQEDERERKEKEKEAKANRGDSTKTKTSGWGYGWGDGNGNDDNNPNANVNGEAGW